MLASPPFTARAARGFFSVGSALLLACSGVEAVGAGAAARDARPLHAASGGGCAFDTECHGANQFCDVAICRTRSCSLSDAFGSLTRVPPEARPSELPPGMRLKNDGRPIMSHDGLRQYFRYDQGGYLGDTDGDIWVAERTAQEETFGAPVNLTVLNWTGTEFPVAVSADGCTLFVASNREHGAGSTKEYELYQARRQPVPQNVTIAINVTGSWTGRVGAPFDCTAGNGGTCSAAQAFGVRPRVWATEKARWSGVCGPNGSNPSSDGLVPFVLEGTCNVSFPAGSGETCLADVDCTGGLACRFGRCSAQG
jgi:hypothetical protein